jgi:hypothetical protein
MTTWRDRRVWDSGLSERAKSALAGAGLLRAGDVARLSPQAIRHLPTVGHKTAVEICFWLVSIFIADELGIEWAS